MENKVIRFQGNKKCELTEGNDLLSPRENNRNFKLFFHLAVRKLVVIYRWVEMSRSPLIHSSLSSLQDGILLYKPCISLNASFRMAVLLIGLNNDWNTEKRLDLSYVSGSIQIISSLIKWICTSFCLKYWETLLPLGWWRKQRLEREGRRKLAIFSLTQRRDIFFYMLQHSAVIQYFKSRFVCFRRLFSLWGRESLADDKRLEHRAQCVMLICIVWRVVRICWT